MQDTNNVLETALFEMKKVEDAIAENAKGILASTMKEEINQLVKESLNEQKRFDGDMIGDKSDVFTDDEFDMEDDEFDMKGSRLSDMEDDEFDMEDDELDMMGDRFDMEDDEFDMEDDELDMMDDRFNMEDDEFDMEDDEFDMEDDEFDMEDDEFDMKGSRLSDMEDDEFDMEDVLIFDGEENESVDESVLDLRGADSETIQTVIEMMDPDQDTLVVVSENGRETIVENPKSLMEAKFRSKSNRRMYNEKQLDRILGQVFPESLGSRKNSKSNTMYEIELGDDDVISEKAMTRPKGVGMGKGPKFSYKKTTGGFKEDKKEGPKTMGTGKPKFEFKKGENMGGKNKIVKRSETKEAARTLGMGKAFRKGGLPKLRAHSKANTAIKESLVNDEVRSLRTKNQEYRKALNMFRDKLNEVAVFNSNLAYTTRLFTEHSTTKSEKINILKRFDGVQTLKESKNLYKAIKDELSRTNVKPINENIKERIERPVSSGSATNLIENRTYENPQFMRMKDLMSKIV